MAGAPEDFVAAYNDRDWERMRGLFATGCVYEQVGHPKRVAEGPGAVVDAFRAWAETAPEAKGEITGSVAAERGAALELDLQGSPQAPFGDFTPTGTHPVARAVLVFELDDGGQIKGLRNYYDSLVLYQVLGIQD